MGSLPLAHMRVVEFSHMVMGPACGVILADLGADVVKVEPLPSGDNTRRLSGSGTGMFPAFNRNKRSIAVDLKSKDGKELVEKLVRQSDVVIENFRPGAMDKMGFGYDSLSAKDPRLVYCSLKGFLSGPYENRTALDEVVQLMGGLAYMTGPPGKPLRAGASVNDIMGGMFAVIGIMAALEERRMTGRGQYVRSGLFENCAFLVSQHIAEYCVTGVSPTPMSVPQDFFPVYDRFDTSDGGQVFVAVVSDSQWKIFCDEFDLDALKSDPRLVDYASRVATRSETIPLIADALRHMTAKDLMERCEKCGLPFAPILRPEELLHDPHLLRSRSLLDVSGTDQQIRVPALPLELDGNRPGVRRRIPGVGEHSHEIALSLGFSGSEVERMMKAGVLGGPEIPARASKTGP